MKHSLVICESPIKIILENHFLMKFLKVQHPHLTLRCKTFKKVAILLMILHSGVTQYTSPNHKNENVFLFLGVYVDRRISLVEGCKSQLCFTSSFRPPTFPLLGFKDGYKDRSILEREALINFHKLLGWIPPDVQVPKAPRPEC